MIIFGTKGVTYTHERGQFTCPSCESGDYTLKRVRRFFTLYWIPVIPLDLLGEYIECDGCRGTFNDKVLTYNPAADNEAFEQEFHRVMRRVLVAMMLADGAVEQEELDIIKTVYNKLTGNEFSQEDIDGEIHRARTDGISLTDYLSTVTSSLNDNGKELVMRAAIMVAAADGEIADEEMAVIAELAGALDLPPAQFKNILSGGAEA